MTFQRCTGRSGCHHRRLRLRNTGGGVLYRPYRFGHTGGAVGGIFDNIAKIDDPVGAVSVHMVNGM